MGLLIFLFESGLFSTIFAISLRGTGAHTKTASAIIAASISGGAVFPFVQDPVERDHGTPYSFCVLVALYSFSAIFALYLNLVPAAKRQVDPVPGEHLRRRRRSSQARPTIRRPCLVSHKPDSSTIEGNDSKSLGAILPRYRRKLKNRLFGSNRPDKNNQSSQSTQHGPNIRSGDSSSEHERPESSGGIMHELAPWPATPEPTTTTGGRFEPITSKGSG
jgi:hypothetical protein